MDDTTMHCGRCPETMPASQIVNHIRLMHPDDYEPLDRNNPIAITAEAAS